MNRKKDLKELVDKNARYYKDELGFTFYDHRWHFSAKLYFKMRMWELCRNKKLTLDEIHNAKKNWMKYGTIDKSDDYDYNDDIDKYDWLK